MARRPWWMTADGIGAGVVIAAAFGAWQAARVIDVLDAGAGGAGRPVAGISAREPDLAGGRTPGGATGRHDPSRPTTSSPARGVRPSDAGVDDLEARDRSGPVATGLAPAETEAEATERLTEDYRKLLRDLEFTRGLPEPPQRRVLPAPEPWRQDEQAAGRLPPVVEVMTPASAPAAGGVEVVLRGRNLRVAQVMFGTAAARITHASPGEVRVVAPQVAPGAVRVALTNDDGHFALVGEPFTFVP